MKLNALDTITRQFEVELPYRETLADYLDYVIPWVQHHSTDLLDKANYAGLSWQEIKDSDTAKQKVLHFFLDKKKYLRATNGDVEVGSWEIIENNKLIIEFLDDNADDPVDREMYELRFLKVPFFVLQKDGLEDYLTLHIEGRNLEWRNYIELLYYTFGSENFWLKVAVALVLVIIGGMVLFSVF